MRLVNERAAVSIQHIGAMLHDCVFTLKDGREVKPLYDAPWRDDTGPEYDALPPIIQKLGSEWPCIPFGRPPDTLDLPAEWIEGSAMPWDAWVHGYASNHKWDLIRHAADEVTATIQYPETTPIRKLTRVIKLLEDRAGLELSLTIDARQPTSFPIGLHPILSMDDAEAGALHLEVADSAKAWSFPIEVEPGQNSFVPNQQDIPLSDMKLMSGGVADLRVLPPKGNTEDLILLTGTNGSVGLSNAKQGCVTTMEWDVKQMPSCMLWISNGGRAYYPWNSRVSALGIEPVASAFDLGIGHSLSNNTPFSKKGIATCISISPDKPKEFRYRIFCEPLMCS